MARDILFVLKVPLNPNQPTNQPCMSKVLILLCLDGPFLALDLEEFQTLLNMSLC